VALPQLHSRALIAGCPPMRAINLGGVGSTLTPTAIARLIAPRVIEHKVAGRMRVVICIDREDRPECAPVLANQVRVALAAELVARGYSDELVALVIADRAFEAWLLADARGLHARGLLLRRPSFHSFEGELGRERKKGVVELTTLLGRQYGKTADGPRLFRGLAFAVARADAGGGYGSRSLDKLLRELGV